MKSKRTNDNISRRRIMKMGVGAATTVGVFSFNGGVNIAQVAHKETTAASVMSDDEGVAASFGHAYSFLDAMMDAYAQGTTVRFVQSYSDQQGLLATGFTYDNALAIIAYLLRGRAEDLGRARMIGDGLLYAQQSDPNFQDGRLRQGYFVDQPDRNGVFLRLALAPFFLIGSAVGDQAWAGIALARLYARTRHSPYLDGAVKLGNWIFSMTFDTRGPGGYVFGVDNGNNLLTFKSTEHNIDVYSLFTMLAHLTGDGVWTSRAQHARNFITAMWNEEAKFFWTGTGPDGAAINRDNIPEDTQTWSFLAMQDELYAGSLDWVKTNLATIDTPQTINSRLTGNIRIQGASYASASLRALAPSSSFDQPPAPNAVWLEGSAHVAASLLARKRFSDQDFDQDWDTVRVLLDNIRLAQEKLGQGQTVGGKALADGQGVVASSSVLNTGFGFSYYPNLHLGATSWYLIAGQLGNPFRL